jgi:hypothetical protein
MLLQWTFFVLMVVGLSMAAMRRGPPDDDD